MSEPPDDSAVLELPPLLADWLPEVARDPLVLSGTQVEMARGNLWSWSPSEEERRTLSREQVATFLEAVARAWAARVDRPCLFYAWYDEMAFSLRFSLVPGRPGDRLPFGAELEILDDPARVCDALLTGADAISWGDLRVVDGRVEDDPEEVRRIVLPVFVRALEGAR